LSVDAKACIEAWDRAGLERLFRYWARSPFALERLEATDAERLVYHLPKPSPDGRTDSMLTPLELIDRLAALIPPPRVHRYPYHGVLAPNAPLRAAVTALARAPAAPPSRVPPAQSFATPNPVLESQAVDPLVVPKVAGHQACASC
jgi:hypothetical protein